MLDIHAFKKKKKSVRFIPPFVFLNLPDPESWVYYQAGKHNTPVAPTLLFQVTILTKITVKAPEKQKSYQL